MFARRDSRPCVYVSGQGRARLSNARATRLDVQASVGFASGRSVSHMLEQAWVRLDQAAQHLTVDADVLEKLKFPRETIQVRLMICINVTALANPLWRGAVAMTTQEDPRREESVFIRKLQRKRWRFLPFG